MYKEKYQKKQCRQKKFEIISSKFLTRGRSGIPRGILAVYDGRLKRTVILKTEGRITDIVKNAAKGTSVKITFNHHDEVVELFFI